MTGRIGVAISTTGDAHRMAGLERCVRAWCAVPDVFSLYVTVDGDEAAARRVAAAVFQHTGSVYRVGQPVMTFPSLETGYGSQVYGPRLGVAVNKNTGVELLMDYAPDIEHLFLSDDDCWPRIPQALSKHIDLNFAHDIRHSLVGWGKSRLKPGARPGFCEWTWPRGVMMYARRTVIESIGGMDERFGPGGHEHAEWSQRIYNAGITPAPFISPASYATRDATGARALWHAEDMPLPGEPRHEFAARKRHATSVRTSAEDWKNIDRIMAEREGSQDFVAYQARENGRGSATLSEYTPSRGAGQA